MMSMFEESIPNSSSLDDTDLISINTKAKCNPVGMEASNSHSSYKLDETSSCNLLNTNQNKLSVQYVNVSSNTLEMNCKNDIQLGASKLDSCENEKRSFVSLPIDNLNDLDASSLKAQPSVLNNNQRVLISPTDFLTLSEETSSAVKKDVNLSTSRLEIIKMFNDTNLTISLDRYCESPFLLEAHREAHLADDDDDPTNNGRVSRLSETHDEMATDDLFASTLTDQHNSLREVVIAPLESESSKVVSSLGRDCIKYINGVDTANIKEEKFEAEEIIEETIGPDDGDSKQNLTLLNPLEQQMLPISPENITTDSNSDLKSNFANEATTSNQIQNGSVTVALPVTPLDIKILSPGLLQLAANLAAVFPSSTIQKQIALQLLREDGTSIIVPIATKSQEPINNSEVIITNENHEKTAQDASSLSLSTNGASNPEADRPFKCELCNSTFTRLGNYTRHKKIHSLSSKEDQRFKCDICGKSFIQRCDLARHLHIHRGTEPHRCSQCGKGYIRHSDLVTHQRFHNKEKPFACPHCSKGFCQRGDLNRHLRSIHLQLKPILCSHCHKKFAKEETLLRHINANHRDTVVN